MKWLVLAGLAVAAIAYFLPRDATELVLADGDRGIADEETVVRLKHFSIPEYPSGRPRQYLSEVKVSGDGGDTWQEAVLSVNHPLRIKGWWIYQSGFSADRAGRLLAQLKCVREPFFPLAVAGWVLALVGAACACLFSRLPPPEAAPSRRRRIASYVLALAAACLPLFIIGRSVLRPEPVPALQSWLLAPHAGAYAASYLILLSAAFGVGRRLMPLGFFLMTAGLVLGAWWGKLAWGAWWQCDPKELWSLATWAAYACWLFAAGRPKAEFAFRVLCAILAVLTLTWVNFSKLFAGLHSYA